MTRAFWLANAVILLDEVLYLAIIPLLPHYAERFDLSNAETGFLYAAYPILVLVSSVPAGLLSERIGVRAMLLAGSGLLVAATVGFAYAETAWQLWSMRALQGLTGGLVATAGMAMIAGGAATARRATTIGAAFSIQGLSALAGYSLGGFVAPALGVATAFLIPAGLGLVLCVALILDRSARPARPPPGRLRANLVGPLRSAPVRASIACFLSVGVIGSAVQTLGPLRLEEAGYSISDLGAIFLLGSLVSLVATPIAGRIADRKGILRAITVWCAATPVVVVVLTVPPGPSWTTVVALVAIVPLIRIGGTFAYARGADYAPLGAGLAAAFGVLVGAWSIGAAIGPLAAGAVADAFGDSAAFLVAAVAAAVVGIPAWRRSKVETDH